MVLNFVDLLVDSATIGYAFGTMLWGCRIRVTSLLHETSVYYLWERNHKNKIHESLYMPSHWSNRFQVVFITSVYYYVILPNISESW